MRSLVLLALLGASIWATATEAEELGEIASGYVYYNRAGATVVEQREEFAACIRDTAVASRGSTPYWSSVLGRLIWNGPIAGVAAAKVENCMLAKRWRAIRLSDAEGEPLAALDSEELVEHLALFVGAQSPPGEMVRTFRNEALRPALVTVASRPAAPSKKQLSFRAFTPTSLPPPPSSQDLEVVSGGTLGGTELAASPPTGRAVVILRVTGISARFGIGVVLAREGSDPPEHIAAGVGFLRAKRENWFAFAVTPGRWRFASSGYLNYCLESPSFEAKSGEIIYAGSFDLAGQTLGPELNLDRPIKWGGPAASTQLKPAVWRNGSVGSCHVSNVVYALEFPPMPE